MTPHRLVLVVLLLVASGHAHANIWERALDPSASAVVDKFEAELARGDEHVLAANARSNSFALLKSELELALQAYRAAATSRPTSGEPYARIANTLHSFYLESCLDGQTYRPSPLRDCSRTDAFDPVIAEQMIAAWDEFEARAPLDPRFSSLGEANGVLFERAIWHTKLATPEHLRKAVRDYEAILARSGSLERGGSGQVWGNLAETQMMLGELDTAIESYRQAARYSSDASTWYGLAVAMDRDGRSSQAQAIVRQQGAAAYEHFRNSVKLGNTFFVPAGEVHYYYALIEETFGNFEAATFHWREFIKSKAHPQFQPRAKEHLDALVSKKRFRPAPSLDPFLDL